MDRKAFALALITSTAAALAGCSADASDTSAEGSADLTSFDAVGSNGACASAAPGRSGEFRGENVRIRFTKSSLGPVALVEHYDAATGLFSQKPDEYQYKQLSDTEVELYYFYTGDRIVPYTVRLDSAGSGGTLTNASYSSGGQSTVAMKCDLRANAPNLKLATKQAVAAPQPITGSFPLPPDTNGGTCTATKLATNGEVVEVTIRREGKTLDETLTAHVFAFDAKTNLLATDYLFDKNAKFSDKETSFSLGSYADILMKKVDGKQTLVLVSKDAKMKSDLGAELPLRCDFVK